MEEKLFCPSSSLECCKWQMRFVTVFTFTCLLFELHDRPTVIREGAALLLTLSVIR